MELYHKYQPVTWHIGVVEAKPDAVSEIVHPLYFPGNVLEGIYRYNSNIEVALRQMEPFGLPVKYLLVETDDGRTVLFSNFPSGATELPTWTSAEKLGVKAYIVRNVPNTISSDRRSGCWGSRVLEFRKVGVTFEKEPTFGLHVTNDAGKWHFYKFGEILPFEDVKTYKKIRKTERFTEEMLVKYCSALGIPVYDKNWYSDKWILIQGKPNSKEKGLTYQEASIKFRINRNVL